VFKLEDGKYMVDLIQSFKKLKKEGGLKKKNG
jgi:hypothetical protein